MGEFDYEREVKVKSGLPDGRMGAEKIGGIGKAASRGKGRTWDHRGGRDEGTRERERLRTRIGLARTLQGRPE